VFLRCPPVCYGALSPCTVHQLSWRLVSSVVESAHLML
ncbi:hypothetical protein A2U01_0043153, partial [Trifolium medium]|nr:hypothetical protein [Trifolium medium]